MVHGLLTSTVAAELGGDIDYTAREITYEFLRPVFTGDTVRVDGLVTKADTAEGQLNVSMEFICHNQNGKELLPGKTIGIIRARSFLRRSYNKFFWGKGFFVKSSKRACLELAT